MVFARVTGVTYKCSEFTQNCKSQQRGRYLWEQVPFGGGRYRLGVPIPNHVAVFSLLSHVGLEIGIKTG